MRTVVIVSSALLLLACGSRGEDDNAMSAYDRAIRDVSTLTFDQINDAHGCADQCEAQEAGFEYAKSNEMFDPDDCPDPDTPFHAGCRAFAEVLDRRMMAREREEFEASRAEKRQ